MGTPSFKTVKGDDSLSCHLCPGSQTGQLKVWLVATGQCIKKIDKAHDAGELLVLSFAEYYSLHV